MNIPQVFYVFIGVFSLTTNVANSPLVRYYKVVFIFDDPCDHLFLIHELKIEVQ